MPRSRDGRLNEFGLHLLSQDCRRSVGPAFSVASDVGTTLSVWLQPTSSWHTTRRCAPSTCKHALWTRSALAPVSFLAGASLVTSFLLGAHVLKQDGVGGFGVLALVAFVFFVVLLTTRILSVRRRSWKCALGARVLLEDWVDEPE